MFNLNRMGIEDAYRDSGSLNWKKKQRECQLADQICRSGQGHATLNDLWFSGGHPGGGCCMHKVLTPDNPPPPLNSSKHKLFNRGGGKGSWIYAVNHQLKYGVKCLIKKFKA